MDCSWSHWGFGMRVLIVLNENPVGSHPDVYEAFEALTAEGTIDGFDVIPFLHMRNAGMPDMEIVEAIRRAVVTGDHGLVIWMHTGSLVVPDDALDAILAASGNPKMAYWEGDSYHPWYKPLPPQMAAIMRRCDAVFMPCGGSVLETLRRAGVRRVLYAPSCASGTRFPHVWRADDAHEHDIVVVGNKVSSRIPFRTMPGARRRAMIVKALIKRYGRGVAVYGSGWTGRNAMGPVAFDEQTDVYRRASLTVGIDNLADPLFFSNRLPITLATGTPILYRRNPGYNDVFPDELRECFFAAPEDLYTGVDRLLEGNAVAPERRSLQGRRFFERNLERVTVARFVTGCGSGYCGDAQQVRGHPHWSHVNPLMVSTASEGCRSDSWEKSR